MSVPEGTLRSLNIWDLEGRSHIPLKPLAKPGYAGSAPKSAVTRLCRALQRVRVASKATEKVVPSADGPSRLKGVPRNVHLRNTNSPEAVSSEILQW